jgi:S-adenosyl methyltransferase
MTVRGPAEIATFFTGWDLVEPGLVTCSQWRPDGNDTTPTSEYAAVGRKMS